MRYLLLTLCLFAVQWLTAQEYTFSKLTQESIRKTKQPQASDSPVKKGDSLLTTYSGGSISIVHYVVNRDNYDAVFNPNPTGLYLNEQHFNYFCDTEKEYKQSVILPADMFEFSYIGRNYLVVKSLRDNNIESKYKCYNLFDITDPNKIIQASFPSIHTGEDTFGDFNFDAIIDFLVVVIKKPETFKGKIPNSYTVYPYTFTPEGLTKQLLGADNGEPAYIFGKGDNNMNKFVVLQHDWFFPLKDSLGKPFKHKEIYKTHTGGFEPLTNCIYTEQGTKVERKKYSIQLASFDDDSEAKKLVAELKSKKIAENGQGFDTYILFDQYGVYGIKWVVLVGNYMTKQQALDKLNIIKQQGYKDAKIRDLHSDY